MTRRLAPQPEG